MKGIDVAKYQGNIDWPAVKAAGVSFAILKALEKKNNKEPKFEDNFTGCQKSNMEIHVYDYVYCQTVQEFKDRANVVITCLGGRKIDGYVWIDIEDQCLMNLGKTMIDGILAYKKVIEDKGYRFGIYTGLSFYNTHIQMWHDWLKGIPFWIARYPSSKKMMLEDEPQEGKQPVIKNDLYMWQYTSNGFVKGISQPVDLNIKCTNTIQGNGQIHSQNGIVTYSLKADGDKQVSTNFKVKEFRCKDGSDRILIDVDFVRNKLQAIRDHFAAPVTINSAYRTQTYNKKVGGAAKSYHLTGQAFDIVVKGHTPAEVARYVQSLGINGIIRYNTFVHVDSREVKYWSIDNNGKVTKVSSF